MKVLIIEDNPEIIEMVTLTLELRWPDVDILSTSYGETGVELAKRELPDTIILDLGLPDIDGFQVLRQIRSFSDVPVLILTVRGDEEDMIRGLEEGADDYIVKPFSPGVLRSRLNVLLRRKQMPETAAEVADTPPISGKLRFDFANQQVSLRDKILELGPREYDLLYHLVTNSGKMLSNQMLMEEVFPEHKGNTRFLDVYMKRLMDKLGDNPYDPTMIVHERGIGYKFIGE